MIQRPLLVLFMITASFCYAQKSVQYAYEPSKEHPFGLVNPDAAEQLKDYKSLIGISDCESISRKPDGTWADAVEMEWKFKYIMNGKAVQDETLKSDGVHSGSIRQYNMDSARWYVTYFSSNAVAASPPTWKGNMKHDKMVLYREQKAPNGMDGYYRLTFYDISDDSFNWIGEWVDKAENIIYPTWKIGCKKRSGG